MFAATAEGATDVAPVNGTVEPATELPLADLKPSTPAVFEPANVSPK